VPDLPSNFFVEGQCEQTAISYRTC